MFLQHEHTVFQPSAPIAAFVCCAFKKIKINRRLNTRFASALCDVTWGIYSVPIYVTTHHSQTVTTPSENGTFLIPSKPKMEGVSKRRCLARSQNRGVFFAGGCKHGASDLSKCSVWTWDKKNKWGRLLILIAGVVFLMRSSMCSCCSDHHCKNRDAAEPL